MLHAPRNPRPFQIGHSGGLGLRRIPSLSIRPRLLSGVWKAYPCMSAGSIFGVGGGGFTSNDRVILAWLASGVKTWVFWQQIQHDLYRSGGPGGLSPASASSCLLPTSSIKLLSEIDSSLLWAVRLGLGTGLYSLPVAVGMHHHKLRGLKQYTFIISQLGSLRLVSLG